MSRSNKNVLHIDPNDYYGGPEAAFSLQEADDWAAAHAAKGSSPADMFTSATVTRPESSSPKDRGSASLSSSRAYSLTLSPQIIYTRSALLSQLVSSRAYRQLEFLALGSSYVLRKQDASQSSSADSRPSLTRIPFSREAIFASQLSARSKRALMKFIKFVLSAESSTGPSSTQPDDQAQAQEAPGNISASASTTPSSILSSHASSPLSSFLSTQFSLDAELQAYVLALTLNLPFSSTQPTGNAGNPSATSQPGPQAATTVSAGMAALRQYLNSWGQFGPGFAAVYPKWGGGSEVAQVACRAGAVGGAVYMLGRRVRRIEKEGTRRGNEQSVEESSQETTTAAEPLLRVELDDGTVLKTKRLVRGWTAEPATTMTAAGADEATAPHVEHERIARLVAVVASPLAELFEATLEGAPKPAVATIAFPEQNEEGLSSIPIYAFVHSSDTGECPVGQSK